MPEHENDGQPAAAAERTQVSEQEHRVLRKEAARAARAQRRAERALRRAEDGNGRPVVEDDDDDEVDERDEVRARQPELGNEQVESPNTALVGMDVFNAASLPASAPRPERRLWRIIAIIVVPIAVAITYLYGFASDRFETPFRFAIRSPESGGVQMLDLGLLGGSSSRAEDLEQAAAFLLSPDMAMSLDQEVGLRAHFQAPAIDALSRLAADATREDYVEYYRKRIHVAVEVESSSLTVTVETFSADMGKRVADAMLARAESFLNALGERPARGRIDALERECAVAEQRLEQARMDALRFQQEHGIPSPEARFGSQNARISSIETAISNEQTALRALRSYLSASAPEVLAASARLAAYEEQLKAEKALALDGAEGLGSLLVKYNELVIAQEFAQERYRGVLAALGMAQAEVMQQAKYLVLLEQPHEAGMATLPARGYWSVSIACLAVLAYGIIAMFSLAIREHLDG